MKKLLLIGFLLLGLPFTRNSSLAASSANDRLYQVDLSEFPKYRGSLDGKAWSYSVQLRTNDGRANLRPRVLCVGLLAGP